jgi:hypothetical protein
MRRLALIAVVALALALPASAWAAPSTYVSGWSWTAGGGWSTSFSPSWWRNTFYKNASFDTTITFIDNVSYGWHSTVRGTATFLSTHWLSSQVKKAHCRVNSNANAWAACTAYN